MKKIGKFAILVLIGVMVMCLASPVFARQLGDEYVGTPRAFRPGESLGIFVWQDDNGWHLRTTTTGRSHSFSGTIRTGSRLLCC